MSARRPKLRDVIAEFEAAGKTVRSLRVLRNGEIVLLTEHYEGALNDAEGDLWDLAGEKAIPRA